MRKLQHTLSLTVVISVAILMLGSTSGCILVRGTILLAAQYDKNVSDQENLWGDFVQGQVYRTKLDLFLVDVKHYTHGPALTIGEGEDIDLGGRGFSAKGPTTAREYKSNPIMWPEVAGIVTAGTTIRAVELREFGNKQLYSRGEQYVKGRILDGVHAGAIVELTALSEYKKGAEPPSYLVGPDAQFLELADESEPNI